MTNPHLTGDVATTNAPSKDKSYVNVNPGPYIGIVKQNSDPEKMGRIKVLIPALSKTETPSESDLILCSYLSPFYGTKSKESLTANDPYDFEDTQHSYGFWAVPPDLDTRVLVIFAEGKSSQAFWIGCIQDAYMNHMTPGIAASSATNIKSGGPPSGGASKTATYGTETVPAGEINKTSWDVNGGNADILAKPVHPFAETLRKQGLIQDTVRGTTTSSARRESPSAVYGMSTPGPIVKGSKKVRLGPIDNPEEKEITRSTGHSFVMDDGDFEGNNHLIRLRSASGHQILLHDTEGVVYIANATGNAWMEFSSGGMIDIYSSAGYNVRAKNNINFHSDANINMFAKGKIKLKAQDKVVVDGRNIQQFADNDIQLHAVGGSVTTKAPAGSILSFANSGQQHHSSGRIDLAGSEVHHNTIGANASVITDLVRTNLMDENPAGTNTLVTPIGDVNPAEKAKQKPLEFKADTLETMDGMRVPTHEPYEYHFGNKQGLKEFSSSSSPKNDSNWEEKSKTVGTPEFIEQANRLSDNIVIKATQFQADLEAELKSFGNSIDVEKLQKVANDFAQDYSKNFQLDGAKMPDGPGPWNDFGKSVSKSGPFDIDSLKTKLTSASSLVQSTVQSITGEATNLLKDKVFINKDGLLFAQGELMKTISTVDKNLIGNLSKGDFGTTTLANVLGDSIVENASTTVNPHLDIKPGKNKIDSLVNKLKSVHKHIVGDKVVNVTEIQKVTDGSGKKIGEVGKNIGNIFGFDTDLSSGSSSSYDIDRLYSDEMYAPFGGKEGFEKAQKEALKRAQKKK